MPSQKPQIIVRVTEAEKVCWERAAGRRLLTLSAYIRNVMNWDADCQELGAGDPGVGRAGEESPETEPPVPSELSKGEEEVGDLAVSGTGSKGVAPLIPEPELPTSPSESSFDEFRDGTIVLGPEETKKFREVIKKAEDVPKILERVGVVAVNPNSPPRPPARSRSKRKEVQKGDGRCTAYAPWGTRCKLCGKVHP